VAEANLAEVSLESADLRRASFIKANFDGSDGTSADLTNANLRDANLSDATLSGVTGLRTSALGGANVSNAKLPEDIAKFEGLEHVAEISRSARPVFLAVVGACVYSWLTIGTTTDPALVTNLAATPLPIIQTEIPIAFFYWAGPVILLALYAYLHMYLQRLWIGLASLPAIFTDGKPLDERAYPWLLTSLVRAYVPRLRADRPPLWWLQVVTSLFAAWALVPLTLLAYWLRYMPRRDWVGIIIIGIALVTAVWLAVAMYRIMRETLGLRDDKRSWRVWPEWVAATGTAALLLAVALSLMNASIPVHTALVRNYADLFGQDVSSKSEEWRDSAQNLDLVIGARLVGRDLSFAYARQAFLVKADLESATLSGADLTAANLWSANLFAANLQRAELERAHLNKATLINADLREADLVGANLTEADLISADLAGANLSFADLQYANLDGANLTGAILVGAKLGAAILKGADLSGAILSNTDRGGEDLLPAEGLSGEQLNDACGNDATRLPSGLFIGPCR
ncbi:MAG: pentapeptide repeat-containing protein, partial [Pseudomonadota bacterium]